MVPKNGRLLIPSEVDSVHQQLNLEDDALSVSSTRVEKAGLPLDTTVWVDETPDGFQTHIRANGLAENGGHFVLALRPYNPEGFSLSIRLHLIEKRTLY